MKLNEWEKGQKQTKKNVLQQQLKATNENIHTQKKHNVSDENIEFGWGIYARRWFYNGAL